MKITYDGTDVGNIVLTDLGDFNKKGADGQNRTIKYGDSLELRDTDNVIKSFLSGAINKFVNNGNFTLNSPPIDAIQVSQETVDGLVSGDLTLSNSLVSVSSILAFDLVTGGPATKTLLELGVDYSVTNGIITLLTDQSSNKLLITYLVPQTS